MITFDPLWETLNSRHMNKTELQHLTGLSSSTMAKLSKGGNIKLEVVDRICEALDCRVEDVVETAGKRP